MKRLLARLESIEATGVLDIDVSWVNGNYQRILFHSVRTASADRVREMAAPRRHLALVCFLHQAWRDTLDQAVDMYGKLLDRNRKRVDERHATPSTGSFNATAGSAPCCSIPTSATTSCAPDCCPSCRRRSCARTSPTWRAGREATERPASSRRPSRARERRRRWRRYGPTANTARRGAAACRPMCRSTSPHRRCSRSSVTTLAGRAQPHDPAGRPAHRGRERPRVQRPLPAAGRAGRPRRGLRAAGRDPRPRLQPRPLHHGEGRPRHRLPKAQERQ